MPKPPADSHMPPAVRRWTARFGLAVIVAILLGYIPAQVLSRDPRTKKLDGQLEALRNEEVALAEHVAALARRIEALRTDVGAIEERARADLGMTYPDEIMFRLAPQGGGERDHDAPASAERDAR